MARLSELFVSIRGDAKDLNKTAAQVKSTLSKIDSTKVEPTVNLDATAQIGALQGKLAALSRTQIKLGVDSATADAEVATLRKQLDTLTSRRREVPLELQDKADKQIAEVERELAAAEKRQTKLPLRLERVDAQIAAVKTQLGKLEREEVDVPVEIGKLDQIKQRVGEIRNAVAGGLSGGRDMADAGEDSGKKFSGALKGTILPAVGGLAAGIGASLAAGGVVEFLSASRDAASEFSETVAKSNNVFGKSADSVYAWSKTSAASFGLSQSAALAATSQFGDMFIQLGFTGEAAAKTSQNLVKTAADLGSFHNVDPSDVLDRISGALRGEYDSLQLLIPNISAARVEQEALNITGKSSTSTLTAQEKATATLAIVQRDGANAADDFAETSGGLANQQRILAAQIEDIQAKVGEKFVPKIASAAVVVSTFLGQMQSGAGAGGQFADFMQRVTDIGETLGTVLKDDVLPVVKGVGSVVGGTFLGSTESAATAISALVAVMAARKVAEFAGSLSGIAGRLAEIGGAAGSVGTKVGTFSKGLGGVAGVLGGPWGIAIGLGVTALVSFATSQKQAAEDAKKFTDTLTFQNGALDDNSRAATANKLAREGTLAAAVQAGVTEKAYTDALVSGGAARQQMIDSLRKIESEHTAVTSAGTGAIVSTDGVGKAAKQAADELTVMGKSLDKSATEADQASKALEGTDDATRKASRSTSGLTTEQGALSDATADLQTAQNKLKSATQQLIDKFTILKSGALDQDRANGALEEAFDSLSGSVKDNGKSLSSNTEKGRANRESIRNAITALNDKVTADFKATGSTKGLSDKLRTGTEDLRKTARAAGFNKDEIDKMIDKMLKTPKDIETEVKTPGVKTAQSEIDDLKKRIRDMKNKGITVKTAIKFDPDKLAKSIIKGDYFNNPGAFQSRAAGGPIQNLSGRGRPGVDTEPVLAAVDEHMWTSDEVKGVGGHKAVYNLRAAAKRGDLRGWENAQHHADGGAILRTIKVTNKIGNVPGVALKKLPTRLASASGEAGVKYSEDIGKKFVAAAKKKVDEQNLQSGNFGRIDLSNPRGLTTFRGKTFTNLFAASLRAAEKTAGRIFSIFQGGFRPSTSYSGTSHQGDAIDSQVDHTLLRAARKHGIAMWDRTGKGNWVPHQHGVPLPGAGYGAGSAVWQAQDYLRGGDGLAKGAVVKARPGGKRVTIGEGKFDEAVIPLPKGWDMAKRDDKLEELIGLLRDQGGRTIEVNLGGIHNPLPETASQTTNRILQRVSSLGLV